MAIGSNDIAVLGGTPAFSEKIHVGRPNLGDRNGLLRRIDTLLDSRWFTNDGPMVREFESRIAAEAGVKHCIAMCNATVAMEIAIRALDLHGEVIVPSYTFVATAHALQWQEITPVFADIDPATHNLDPAQIERLVTPRTTGIIGVHVWGRPCDTDRIESIARKQKLRVMYDAAHAFGCSRRGRMVGGFGACEVFSFHATKFVSSFEGGAIVTNDDALAEKVRLMRNFGFAGYDRVVYVGTNGKMPEICAAMGLTSLDAMAGIVGRNLENYHEYRKQLEGVPGLSLIEYDSAERNNYHYVVVEVDPGIAALNRDEIVAMLHAENVLARKYFWPGCHRMEPYASYFPNAGLLLGRTERLAATILVLPTGQSLEPESVAIICSRVKQALARAPEVRRALKKAAPTGATPESMAIRPSP